MYMDMDMDMYTDMDMDMDNLVWSNRGCISQYAR